MEERKLWLQAEILYPKIGILKTQNHNGAKRY